MWSWEATTNSKCGPIAKRSKYVNVTVVPGVCVMFYSGRKCFSGCEDSFWGLCNFHWTAGYKVRTTSNILKKVKGSPVQSCPILEGGAHLHFLAKGTGVVWRCFRVKFYSNCPYFPEQVKIWENNIF